MNGKSFPLMSLPAELRDTVYEYALGPYLYPFKKEPTARVQATTYVVSKIHRGNGNPAQNGGRLHRAAHSPPNLALLRVSKQVPKCWDRAVIQLAQQGRSRLQRYELVALIWRLYPLLDDQ